MKVRETGYEDYGLTNDEVKFLFQTAKNPEFSNIVMTSCYAANRSISFALAFSIVYSVSFEKIKCVCVIPYEKDDFYAYRRKAIAIFSSILNPDERIKNKK